MQQLPINFHAWKHCLEHDCGITLTTAFVQERIAALNNLKDDQTSRFVACYVEAYRQQVIRWFGQWLQPSSNPIPATNTM